MAKYLMTMGTGFSNIMCDVELATSEFDCVVDIFIKIIR